MKYNNYNCFTIELDHIDTTNASMRKESLDKINAAGGFCVVNMVIHKANGTAARRNGYLVYPVNSTLCGGFGFNNSTNVKVIQINRETGFTRLGEEF